MKYLKHVSQEARATDLPEPQGEIKDVTIDGVDILVPVNAKYFAVDANGEGHTFTKKPVWLLESWAVVNVACQARYVGNFDIGILEPSSALWSLQ